MYKRQLLECARTRDDALLRERVRCVRLIRIEGEPLLKDQKVISARLDDGPGIEQCEAVLEREEATVWDKLTQVLLNSNAAGPVASRKLLPLIPVVSSNRVHAALSCACSALSNQWQSIQSLQNWRN